MSVIFYVSGLGWGHATRTAEVIREFQRLRPDVQVYVRTLAPAHLFPEGVVHTEVQVDPEVVEEESALRIDTDASVRQLKLFLRRSGELVEAEERFVREKRARLIVADVPFVAGRIAPELPHVAIGNFTWDWIYSHMICPFDRPVIEEVRRAYAKFGDCLRLPLSQPEDWQVFGRVVDVPLIARKSKLSREESRRRMGFDGKKVAMLASRAAVDEGALAKAARDMPDWTFVTMRPIASGENIVVRGDDEYSDVLCAADAVVGKLGYGMASECIAAGTAILYPPREGFPEEAIIQREIVRYVRAAGIDSESFQRGEWESGLRAIERMPGPTEILDTDGAAVCARFIADLVS